MPSDNSLSISGELYFIRERDPSTGEVSDYVKVGLVKDGGRGENPDRLSADRVDEHQTGNPRKLFLVHVIKSPAIAFLENKIHGIFANFRVSGEWFKVSEEALQLMIEESERRALELRLVEYELAHSDDYKLVAATEEVIVPDEDINAWYERWLGATLVLKTIAPARKRIADLSKAAATRGEDVSRVANVQVVEQRYFAKDEFSAAYPDLCAEFQVTELKLTGSFTMERTALKVRDIASEQPALHATLVQLNDAIDRVERNEIPVSSLLELQLALEPFEARADWEKELAEVCLKTSLGPAKAIEGVCKWDRRFEPKERFDEKQLALMQPEIYEMFTRVRQVERAVPVNRNQDGATIDVDEESNTNL